MPAEQYKTVVGFVQFEVNERQANNQTVRDVTVRDASDGRLIRATLWDDFAGVDVNEGDFVAIDGKITERQAQNKDGESVTYRNMSVSKLIVLPPTERKERAVVNASEGTKAPF